MAKLTDAKAAFPYIQRVLEDEYVQEQLRSAVTGARAAYLRAREQRTQVVQDKGLYRNLRQATTALQRATGALSSPQPEPKQRGRKVAFLALAMGATVLLTMKLQQHQSQRAHDVGTAAPPSAPSADETETRDQSRDPAPAAAAQRS
jgi:hypothetical protein